MFCDNLLLAPSPFQFFFEFDSFGPPRYGTPYTPTCVRTEAGGVGYLSLVAGECQSQIKFDILATRGTPPPPFPYARTRSRG